MKTISVLTFALLCTIGGGTENCRMTTDGKDYMGPTDHTYKGILCQRWDSDTPHDNPDNDDDEDFPDATVGDAGNKCRNPDDEPTLWCYTTDSETDWDWCDVDLCPGVINVTNPPLECRQSPAGAEYRGTKNSTYKGVPCQRWDQQTPHSHSAGPKYFSDENFSAIENYCRNPIPEEQETLWCYTTDSETEWDWCDVDLCPGVINAPSPPLECLQSVSGVEYRGTMNVTKNNVSCQRWDEHTPHSHYKGPDDFTTENFSAIENYCRNPDGEPTVWCFTTDPYERFDLCDVPLCGGELSDNCYIAY